MLDSPTRIAHSPGENVANLGDRPVAERRRHA
jgi:hypothetical protein